MCAGVVLFFCHGQRPLFGGLFPHESCVLLVNVSERTPEESTAPPIRWAVVGRTIRLGGLWELGRVGVGFKRSLVLLGRKCKLFVHINKRLSVGNA